MHLLEKTKVMLNNHTNKVTFTVDGKIIEEVEKYVYLGKTVTGMVSYCRTLRDKGHWDGLPLAK